MSNSARVSGMNANAISQSRRVSSPRYYVYFLIVNLLGLIVIYVLIQFAATGAEKQKGKSQKNFKRENVSNSIPFRGMSNGFSRRSLFYGERKFLASGDRYVIVMQAARDVNVSCHAMCLRLVFFSLCLGR
jgi:hypothetical protein